ncbi:MAG: anti-ECFsigma factor, ChrR [Gemmatimonadetes bacterium]|nr:anti-ECFsigma factor, ChrR [Gemmatimonadota bacterium]
MRRSFTLVAAGLVGTCSLLSAQAAPALKWGPAPAVFPAGAQMAVVSGDPGKAAPFVIELSMPSGYRIPPHFHPTDEKVTVDKGTFLVGMGETFDKAKTKPMAVGATGEIKAGMAHFAMAQGATVVTVSAMGPFAMTYVNPLDDPTKVMAKP